MENEPVPIRSFEALDTQVPDLTVEAVITALTDFRGNISACCRALNKGRGQLMDFINRKPELCRILDDVREEVLDRAESNVFAQVEKGDVAVSLQVLATLGKNRGWSTRNEVTGKDGADLAPPTIIIRMEGDGDVNVEDPRSSSDEAATQAGNDR